MESHNFVWHSPDIPILTTGGLAEIVQNGREVKPEQGQFSPVPQTEALGLEATAKTASGILNIWLIPQKVDSCLPATPLKQHWLQWFHPNLPLSIAIPVFAEKTASQEQLIRGVMDKFREYADFATGKDHGLLNNDDVTQCL